MGVGGVNFAVVSSDFDDDLITAVENNYSDCEFGGDLSETTESSTAVGMPDE
jgi:hypothetical protein